jgi:malonate-semialdehyde dehydrogenase (acetylating)/methylmalonate-semialdehyde dehydrogenase
MIPFWFLPYAIVLGDTILVKPSEITPVPMQRVAELIHDEVKLPPGVFNLVHGGKDVVESSISNPGVKGVCFVGSSSVARYVYKLAGEHGKRAIAQGGAKNSIVVMPDANLDQSIGPIVSSFFGNAGQRCLAGANLFPVGDVHESLVGKFANSARALRIGYGLDEGVQMGPVVSQKAKQRIISEIEKGENEGAKVVSDGRNLLIANYPEGYYLGPTIFDDVSSDMKVAKEEVFGPVASVMPSKDLDDAIETINRGTRYGNMACIFTASGRSAREFRRRVDAGNIGINIGVAGAAANFPFAGRRDSFFGILHAQIDTVDFFTDKKVVVERWPSDWSRKF